MRFIFVILVVLFTSISLFAQEEAVAGELSIWVKNNSQNKQISMTLELVSPACWDENHYITELFNGGIIDTVLNNGWLEFLICWETTSSQYYRTYGLGLYKVTAKINNVAKDHFFIDYRTSDLPDAIWYTPPPGCQIDYALDFDVAAEKFYYRNTQNLFSDYHAFWNLRPCVEFITDGLVDYWANALAVIPSQNNKPFLVWGPYPEDQHITEVTYYEIWRKYGSQEWSYLDFVNGSTYTFEDEELTLAGLQSGTTVVYKIRAAKTALPENLLSDYSNSASVVVNGEDPGKRNSGNYGNDNISSTEFALYQNYPNPFNPTTIITYQTPTDNFVTLKVFDIMGREVTELENTYKSAGTHSIEFNASELSSGIYLYRIQIGKYSETRKLYCKGNYYLKEDYSIRNSLSIFNLSNK